MGLSRRFHNVIMENRFGGAKSLCSVDLTRQLFDNIVRPPSTIGDGSESLVLQDCTPEILAAEAGNQKNELAAVALKMKRIRLPSPIFTFQTALNEPCKIGCFPLVDRKMLWADHLGRTFLFDTETRQMEIIPKLHKPKSMPFSLFVPNADADNDYDQDRFGSSLFVMERIPKPEGYCSTKWSEQFEAFIYRYPTMETYSKSWECQLLPPPPYVRRPKYWHNCRRPEISSYGLLSVSGDSHICISVEGVGTYCMDTARHKWRKVGKWILPFHGRVEYVPELKLWFGFNKARHLAAADISAMDSQPQLVGSWKELYLPEEWKECKDPQLVNLGCGRFCIIRFFHTGIHNGDPESDVNQNVAVFSGVEVVPCVHDANGGSGKVGLQMIPYKSLCHMSNGITVNDVF
ncbi:unnamed protein product [Urochloa humidicola]